MRKYDRVMPPPAYKHWKSQKRRKQKHTNLDPSDLKFKEEPE